MGNVVNLFSEKQAKPKQDAAVQTRLDDCIDELLKLADALVDLNEIIARRYEQPDDRDSRKDDGTV